MVDLLENLKMNTSRRNISRPLCLWTLYPSKCSLTRTSYLDAIVECVKNKVQVYVKGMATCGWAAVVLKHSLQIIRHIVSCMPLVLKEK